MAVVIMKKHIKKQEKKRTSVTVKCVFISLMFLVPPAFVNLSFTYRHWLKVSVSLTLVMGITWVAGLLVFRKELVTLAYIMTVFIAGQGILLFIILVPLSKQVGSQVRYTYMHMCMAFAQWKYIKNFSSL